MRFLFIDWSFFRPPSHWAPKNLMNRMWTFPSHQSISSVLMAMEVLKIWRKWSHSHYLPLQDSLWIQDPLIWIVGKLMLVKSLDWEITVVNFRIPDWKKVFPFIFRPNPLRIHNWSGTSRREAARNIPLVHSPLIQRILRVRIETERVPRGFPPILAAPDSQNVRDKGQAVHGTAPSHLLDIPLYSFQTTTSQSIRASSGVLVVEWRVSGNIDFG